MRHRYFVTAAGTGIGKTFITAALCHQLGLRGVKVQPLKPVITGWVDHAINPEEINDTQILLTASGLSTQYGEIQFASPWRFSAPLSPHMAAARQMTELSVESIAAHCREAEKRAFDALIVEGAGGVMVPLNRQETTLELMQALDYPVILVVGTYLGAISHGLTAHLALKQAGLTVALVVVNESEESTVDFLETARTFAALIPAPMISCPRLPSSQTWKQAPDSLVKRLLQTEPDTPHVGS